MSTIIKIQHLRGTAAQWTDRNPVLPEGEFGVETDTLYVKVGNGIVPWNMLPYIHSHGTGGGSTGGGTTLTSTQIQTSFTTTLVATDYQYTYTHNSGRYPVIVVLDGVGKEAEVEVTHNSVNETVIKTQATFTGTLVATLMQAAQTGTSITTALDVASGDYIYNLVHSLSQFPVVRILDGAGAELEIEVQHVTNNELNIITSSTITGTLLIH